MISRQNENKISKRKSDARFLYLANRSASEKWQRTSKKSHRHYRRSERQLTRQDLKVLARGNPHLDEVEALEADQVQAMMDSYHYYLDAEQDWYEYEDDEERRHWEDYMESFAMDEPLDDDRDRAHGYDHVDEDDSLMH